MGTQSGDGRKVIASWRKARHEYEISDTFEAGLVLQGTEVKTLREGKVTLTGGFIQVKGGEIWLFGVHIPEYEHGSFFNHEPTRPRKLLLHLHEIARIESRIAEKGFTAVPLQLYFKRGRVKLELGLGKGRKLHDKRQAAREKTDRREMRQIRERF
ncbi:MAG: SsrA-binding protein SmpB [Bradymonadia bacterium]